MKVWIPEKNKIVSILRNLADKLEKANTVSDIDEWLIDELSTLDCHIENRSSIERGIISE